MKTSTALFAICAGVCIVGCEAEPKSAKGFTLPDGDVDRGKATFVRLECAACHKITGIERPELPDGTKPEASVRIGGEVSRIKTYGELVTSIINPSHKLAPGYTRETIAEDGESRMTNYNDVMTVQELIDLVAFLQSQYKLHKFEPTEYPTYYYMGG